MSWLRRKKKGIVTPTGDKKELPDGLWYKTPKGTIIHKRELKKNDYVCPDDGYHVRIGSAEYFEILFDNKDFEELDKDIRSSDRLNFVDTKSYKERLQLSTSKTGLKDAVRTAYGEVGGNKMVLACMDFSFIGGSMGVVVGEKISRAAAHAHREKIPYLVICKSGGARMMEAGFSLMQLPKVITQLILLHEDKIPYLTLLTDPTTGGVSASFGMLGDVQMAEPQSLIGFAGPRVIRETMGKDLPEGFQTAEFVQESGFVDIVVDRRQLKETLVCILKLLNH
ncbi:MAG: acetyl-CoA carboxylase, carboxyltransferase subunit beta [Cytophagales bacterium]|nr:acetyl-CoA carboxylase, carboxyltransferase subunit beta [Cytophagales bacterium]